MNDNDCPNGCRYHEHCDACDDGQALAIDAKLAAQAGDTAEAERLYALADAAGFYS